MAGSQERDPSIPFPLPKILTYPSSGSPPELIAQGAEGRLYKSTYLRPDLPCALKYRPPKLYRHPVLDARLTRQRILAEARILARCRRDAAFGGDGGGGGVTAPVPAVYALDEAAGWLMMEWIEGEPVRARLNEWLRRKGKGNTAAAAEEEEGGDGDKDDDPHLDRLLRRVGHAVGTIHCVGVVHGDLTTSNMMLRPRTARTTATATKSTDTSRPTQGDGDPSSSLLDGDVVVIDFGLASQSSSDEDRAVDLYVLERAFGSTHPRAESLFTEVLAGYSEAFKQAGPVLRKLEDVRMRGRKRSMIG